LKFTLGITDSSLHESGRADLQSRVAHLLFVAEQHPNLKAIQTVICPQVLPYH